MVPQADPGLDVLGLAARARELFLIARDWAKRRANIAGGFAVYVSWRVLLSCYRITWGTAVTEATKSASAVVNLTSWR